ncbi:glycosyltransferase [Flavobacterium sp. WC2429]|uniref:Glycosyltransferase n=1 Tax=Flavobacterium sp. WC2429 TaxID=3234140 RepID=A0AB39WPT3_9FLAO
MLKILHIISGASPETGGPIQGIRNYEKALFDLGVQRDLVCFENPEAIKGWGFPSTLNVIGLGQSKTGWQYNKKFVPWLEANVIKYDHIIMDGMWSYHTYATIKVIHKLRRKKLFVPKVYLMPHGMLDPWFQKDEKRRIKAIRNYIYWYLIEQKVVNSVDGLLFTCQEELLLARTTFPGYNPKKEYNIGFGIVTPPKASSTMIDEFYEKFDINKEQSYLLFLSRIHPKKGVDLLLEAYADLLSNNESIDQIPQLIIAGSGLDTDYGKELEEYVTAHPVLKEKVQFVGHLGGDLKWGAIYGCEAFILPSHQENFGIAIAEALACSKAVLITNKVNIFREIEKGKGGLVAGDTESGTYKNLHNWLSLSSEEKKKMGVNAYSVYQQHFNIENAAKTYFTTMTAPK